MRNLPRLKSLNLDEPINHILFVKNLDQGQIQLLQETSYLISLDVNGNLLVNSELIPDYKAILFCVPIPSLKRHTFRIIAKSPTLEETQHSFYVNGQCCECHDLVHGDVVQFGYGLSIRYYTLPATLDINTLQDLLKVSNGENWYETCLNIFNSFSPSLPTIKGDTITKELARLALLSEFSPEYIINFSLSGELFYINSTALQEFPDLREKGLYHPLFQDIHLQSCSEFTQEITLKDHRLLRTIQIDQANKMGCLLARRLPNQATSSQAKISNQISPLTSEHQQLMPKASVNLTSKDDLTNLPDRRSVTFYLKEVLAKRRDNIVAVYLLDLDNFTYINEAFGYFEGDRTLNHLAQRLKNALDENAFLGRWEGDQFVAILFHDHFQSIPTTAQTIIDSLKGNSYVQQQEIYFNASIGIALSPHHGEDVQTLIEKAYVALRKAKRSGEQRYQFFPNQSNIESQTDLKEELKLALERDQLSIHYQPVLNPQSGSILSIEGLLRWHHPQWGFIDPRKFLPIAEETGLICAIGQWVLRSLCIQQKRWQKMGLPKIPISINFSSRQLRQTNLRQNVSQICNDTGFDSRYLIIEVNESTLIEDLSHTPSVFWELHELGIHFCVDDFGNDDSSFSRLQKLPIDQVKTVPFLIADLANQEGSQGILEAMLTLSKTLKLQLVVKGVAGKEQLGLLRELYCQAVQGNFVYAPMPDFQITQILQKYFQYVL